MELRWRQPVLTGVVTALTGFASTSAVVLSGLTAAGASRQQAASGLIALCVAQGVGMVWLSRRYRQPITLAWSTPGAALLVSGGGVGGQWRAAVGAFVLAAVLTALIAVVPSLTRLVALIPPALAQAMLAGVLLPLCLRAVDATASGPELTVPVVVLWLVMLRVAAPWATASAFALAVVLIVTAGGGAHGMGFVAPDLTVPAFPPAAVFGLAVPLVVVTMAAQNVPGAAIMAAHGYDLPWRPSLLTTAGGSLLGAFAGGHAVNLAAITAALPASAQCDPDPDRRWIGSATCGWLYVGLGAVSPAVASVLTGRAQGVVDVVAGLALLGTLVGALAAATRDERTRLPVAVTVVVGASSLTIAGVGSALWSLVAGAAAWVVLVRRPAGVHDRASVLRRSR